jgi:arylsulfatase A-like enzyme
MRNRFLFHTAFAAVALFLSLACQSAHAAGKPNVLIFYADDLGWGELGCQGNPEIPTPNIDSLATNGLRCTQGYVAATYCSPSRAALMTGRYPTRFGHEFNSVANVVGLAAGERTMADRLKAEGYATACIGKWHLGNQPQNRPTRRGFDEFYGTLANTPFFHPTNFVDSRISDDVRAVTDPNFYTTDAYAERAVDWIGKQKDRPWFLYLPFNAQHAPLQAPQKYLDRFPNIADENRKIFAAMMSAMDDAVGRVLAKVREMGQEENTLVFYVADNGGPTQSTTSKNGPLNGFKMTTYEGGPRVPFLVQWKGKLPAGKTYDLPVINTDILPTALAAGGTSIDPGWKLDGINLLPYLTGQNTGRPHETLYWRYGPQWAIRHGDLKLVVSRGGSGQPELFDLSKDIGERNNLAASQPEKVKQLQALWDGWSAEQAPPSAPDTPAGQKKAKAKAKAERKAKRAAKAT